MIRWRVLLVCLSCRVSVLWYMSADCIDGRRAMIDDLGFHFQPFDGRMLPFTGKPSVLLILCPHTILTLFPTILASLVVGGVDNVLIIIITEKLICSNAHRFLYIHRRMSYLLRLAILLNLVCPSTSGLSILFDQRVTSRGRPRKSSSGDENESEPKDTPNVFEGVVRKVSRNKQCE